MVFEIFKRVMENLRSYGKRCHNNLAVAWGIASYIFPHSIWRLLLGMKYFGDSVVIVWNGQTSLQAVGVAGSSHAAGGR